MVWESTTLGRELYEERLRDAERERYAHRIWMAQRASRPRWSAKLSSWMADWKVWTGYQRVFQNRELTMNTGDR